MSTMSILIMYWRQDILTIVILKIYILFLEESMVMQPFQLADHLLKVTHQTFPF